MLLAENLASIESEGRRLIAAARSGPRLEVPQYPDWTLADLASHTGSIHGRTTLICRELPSERISAPRPPEGRDPVAWAEEQLEQMLAALEEADPEAPVWGFGPSPKLGFWERRMVIETGVHRWDAEQATGRDEPLTDHVAISGMDEFPHMWHPMLGELEPLELAATDVDRTWVFGGDEAGRRVEGTVSDLYLSLVSRPSGIDLPGVWATAIAGIAPPPKR